MRSAGASKPSHIFPPCHSEKRRSFAEARSLVRRISFQPVHLPPHADLCRDRLPRLPGKVHLRTRALLTPAVPAPWTSGGKAKLKAPISAPLIVSGFRHEAWTVVRPSGDQLLIQVEMLRHQFRRRVRQPVGQRNFFVARRTEHADELQVGVADVLDVVSEISSGHSRCRRRRSPSSAHWGRY